jgi:hypothetical protein
LQPHLPAYDFPLKEGYVAPGAHLIINDMACNTSHDGRDVYSISQATIHVTCKPKITYPSSATNWSNNMYSDRLRYPQEHEVPDSGCQVSRAMLSDLVVIKDSAKQFLISSIPEDYQKCLHGGDHLEREKLRVFTLEKRLKKIMADVTHIPENALSRITNALAKVSCLMNFLMSSPGALEVRSCKAFYSDAISAVSFMEEALVPIVPKYRPVDILTSDAGPGVGTSEKIVKLRSAEHFLINDLDLHCRMHFAPRNSKSHPVERVMAALNDALGDGRHITPQVESLFSAFPSEDVFSMNEAELADAMEQLNNEAAKDCARQIAERYEGTSCMKTSIHASLPDFQFYYDEDFMLKWHRAGITQKKSLPGHHYYSFLDNFFQGYAYFLLL